MSDDTDPLREFFGDLGHRLDLYRTLVPVGHTWPTLNVHDLYLAWIRDSQNRHEVRLLIERLGFLGEENDRLRKALIESCEPQSEGADVVTEATFRCGFQIEHSLNLLPDRPGAYRVSKGRQSNIIGEKFFDEINGDSDHAFVEFMTAALRPDFPHPFAVEE